MTSRTGPVRHREQRTEGSHFNAAGRDEDAGHPTARRSRSRPPHARPRKGGRTQPPAAVSTSYLIDAIKTVGCGDVALLLVDKRPFAAACADERTRTPDAARRAGLDQLARSDAALIRAALSGLGVVVFPRRAYSAR